MHPAQRPKPSRSQSQEGPLSSAHNHKHPAKTPLPQPRPKKTPSPKYDTVAKRGRHIVGGALGPPGPGEQLARQMKDKLRRQPSSRACFFVGRAGLCTNGAGGGNRNSQRGGARQRAWLPVDWNRVPTPGRDPAPGSWGTRRIPSPQARRPREDVDFLTCPRAGCLLFCATERSSCSVCSCMHPGLLGPWPPGPGPGPGSNPSSGSGSGSGSGPGLVWGRRGMRSWLPFAFRLHATMQVTNL
jgi:hypothetical protein